MRKLNLKVFLAVLTVAAMTAVGLPAAHAATADQSMMVGLGDWEVEPIFTVGETINGYTPAGVLDGMGAFELDDDTVRVLVNHELLHFRGYPFSVSNGFSMTGARISYFDIDKDSKQIVDAGLAINTVYDANGLMATDLSFQPNNLAGFSRFCSGSLFEPHEFGNGKGLEDRIYMAGEEDGGFFSSVGGAEWALDPETGDIWHLPDLGRGAWENVTFIDTGSRDTVGVLLADDTSPFDFDGDGVVEAAPLFLYVGEKDPNGDFPARNGLRGGDLFVWVADDGSTTPSDFNTSGHLRGTWVEVDNSTGPASNDGSTGYDNFGNPTQGNLWLQAKELGAFGFSRPEDIATNPDNGREAVFASTGVDNYDGGSDSFGTIYKVKTNFRKMSAKLTIVYDGDADPTRALRSPDNLDWADDGRLYIQEDEAEETTIFGEPLFGPGAANPNEAGIVSMKPNGKKIERIANIDRSVVLDPTTAGTPVDQDAGNAGEWESSGILDVSDLFDEDDGTLFLFDVEAHGIEDQDDFNADSRITDGDLVEGGQLSFLFDSDEVDFPDDDDDDDDREGVRFATFNASLNRGIAGALATELSAPGSAQPDVIAEIIQRTRPEVLLINEFDFDAGNVALDGFQANYLGVPHGDADPIDYPYRYTAPSNTGIFSGFDLDNSGGAGDFAPNDSFGFGFFPGQFGMAVYSMHPIDFDEIRTFQNFLWKDMPGALLPDDPAFPGPADWYSPAELDVFRLSSKSHWDVPIEIDGETVHFLVSHPTPPVFDGPEDRNGTRNHDEIRFWADYVHPGRSGYIYDDDGDDGGLDGDDLFVIAGDQNSDPFDGDSIPGAIQQLLESPKVNTKVTPSSPGGPEQAALQGDNNLVHLSDPAFDTADFGEAIFGGPGNLRVDYVLPRKNMKISDAGVFWPLSSDPDFGLVGTFPFPSSDHRLVWIDVEVDD
ncbi:MAG: endonuclease/exonuclease/phosphatase family protein [Acidimicrobiales bacterium]